MRGPAYAALPQLSVFGQEAVPTLLFLVDVGASLRADRKKRPEEWQHPYLAGLTGLCRAGSSAAAAIPSLIERVGWADILTGGSHGRLVVQTLIRLGAPPVAVEAAFVGAGARPEDIQRDLKQARLCNECTY